MDATERAAIDAVLATGHQHQIDDLLERLAAGDDESIRLCVSLLYVTISAGSLWQLQTFMKDRPVAIDALIEVVERDPFTRHGSNAAYLLGDIGLYQGEARDPRIVPVLVRAIEKGLPEFPRGLTGALSGLQEAVIQHVAPEATRMARVVLDALERRTTRDPPFATQPCVDILWRADRADAKNEIERRLARLPEDHWMRKDLKEALEEKIAET